MKDGWPGMAYLQGKIMSGLSNWGSESTAIFSFVDPPSEHRFAGTWRSSGCNGPPFDARSDRRRSAPPGRPP